MADTATSSDGVRILIADSAELVRRGIRDVLARSRRFSVVGEVAQAEEVVEACLEFVPDVVFLGLGRDSDDGPGSSAGLSALRRVLQLEPSVCVLVLVDGDTVEGLLEPVRAGARGVLLRDAPASTLLEALRDVLAGGAALDPRLTRSLFEQLAADLVAPTLSARGPKLAPSVLGVLSPREQEVLGSLAQGKRNKEIAIELGVSVGTVKTHLRHIFRKLTVADRTAAVLTALRVQLPEAA